MKRSFPMNIYYDADHQKWCHNNSDHTFFIFGSDELHPLKNGHKTEKEFTVTPKKGKIGPLVGILTGCAADGTYYGNIPLFKNIQMALQAKGGLSFIFCLDGINDNFIDGSIYHIESETWVDARFPFPDLVYNRMPSRAKEKSRSFQNFVRILGNKGIPFFNPSYLNKWEVYQAFKKDKFLSDYLPETRPFQNLDSFQSFLSEKKRLYAKHRSLSQGNGIDLLIFEENGAVTCQNVHQKRQYPSIESCYADRKEEWTGQYILQEAVETEKINGNKYDFRVLVHYQNKNYIVTGIGVRVSTKQQITTHTTNGGKRIPFQHLASPALEKQISDLANACGHQLSKEFDFFGEFSMDIGKKKTGELVLFEVNAKPMSFDEIEIEKKRLKHLTHLFFEKTNFEGTKG